MAYRWGSSQDTQPASDVTGTKTSSAPETSRGGYSCRLTWSRFSPSQRVRPGRRSSSTAAQPPWLTLAVRATTSAWRMCRRRGPDRPAGAGPAGFEKGGGGPPRGRRGGGAGGGGGGGGG